MMLAKHTALWMPQDLVVYQPRILYVLCSSTTFESFVSSTSQWKERACYRALDTRRFNEFGARHSRVAVSLLGKANQHMHADRGFVL